MVPLSFPHVFLAQCLVLDLLDKYEFSVSVERMVGFTEVFAHTEGGLYVVDIFPMVVKSDVEGGFRFANIL